MELTSRCAVGDIRRDEGGDGGSREASKELCDLRKNDPSSVQTLSRLQVSLK